MTNQEAADLIRRAIAEIEWTQPMEYAAAFDKAIETLEAAGWISVEDRLPEVGQTVIGLSKYGHVSDMTLREIKNGELKHCLIFDPLGYLPGKDVKYWMPMPEEPRKDKDDDE